MAPALRDCKGGILVRKIRKSHVGKWVGALPMAFIHTEEFRIFHSTTDVGKSFWACGFRVTLRHSAAAHNGKRLNDTPRSRRYNLKKGISG